MREGKKMHFSALGSRGPLWRATVGVSSSGTLSLLHSLDFPVLPYASHRGSGSPPRASQPLGKKSYFKHVLFFFFFCLSSVAKPQIAENRVSLVGQQACRGLIFAAIRGGRPAPGWG